MLGTFSLLLLSSVVFLCDNGYLLGLVDNSFMLCEMFTAECRSQNSSAWPAASIIIGSRRYYNNPQ